MNDKPELYFPRDVEWFDWLLANHDTHPQGVYLIFYKLEANVPSMRWEEAVKVALCFGWIDSTVQGLGGGKRRQFFCKRNPKSSWSALNKKYVKALERDGLMQPAGQEMIALAKKTGTWSAMDDVENLIIPKELKQAFDNNPVAFENYQNFSRTYKKSYLSWLHSAKRPETREKRITAIIENCKANKKMRD